MIRRERWSSARRAWALAFAVLLALPLALGQGTGRAAAESGGSAPIPLEAAAPSAEPTGVARGEASATAPRSGEAVDTLTSEAAFLPTFHGPGLDGTVSAATVWDDGSGPALYLAGDFVTAGEHVVNGIARWDGAEWSPLAAAGGTGLSGWTGASPTRALALTVHDGALYVGGNFTEAGGVTVNHVARWDGAEWSALDGQAGPGVGGHVQGLASYEGALIVGGLFTQAGGDPRASWIARWDGGAWSPLLGVTPSGLEAQLSGTVRAVTVFEGELVAAGGFLAIAHWNGSDWIDQVFAGGIARWDGEDWRTLSGASGTGTDSFVNALAVLDGALFLGGHFTESGGLPAGYVAAWDGSEWSTLGGGVGVGVGSIPHVSAVAAHDGDLFVGGHFTEAGGAPAELVARWDGAGWSPVAGPGGGLAATGALSRVNALATFDGALVAGGPFLAAAGAIVNGLAGWDGAAWSSVGSDAGGIPVGSVQAATVYDGELIVGGTFGRAGSVAARALARWDGTSWAPLAGPDGEGVDGFVSALAVYDGDLIVAGGFTEAGGVAASRIARWNGYEWAPLGSGVEGALPPRVNALTVIDGTLVAGGTFTAAGGVQASRIARWDGSAWSAIGGGMNNEVLALASYGGELVAGGRFTQAGGITVNRVARWDGTEWMPFTGTAGTGVSLLVSDLVELDGHLFVGGSFSSAGGIATRNIAGWDGSDWYALGPGIDSFGVSALAAFDGDLIVGGAFTEIGGEAYNRIARWDGSGWSHLVGPAGEGLGGIAAGSSALALHVHGERLVVGGSFLTAGGAAAWNVALYGVPEAEPIEIELTGEAYKHRGNWFVDLAWSGTAGEQVDVLRDGEVIATVDGASTHTDALGKAKKGTTFAYRICLAGGETCSNELTIVIDPRPAKPPKGGPAIVTQQLPDLSVLEPYAATLEVEGGSPPYSWTADGLPAGLALDPSSGVIASDPADPAIRDIPASTVVVTVADATGATAQTAFELGVVGVSQVAVGDSHACAATSAGTAYCWGSNTSGQLGNGSTGSDPVSLPVAVVDPDEPGTPLTAVARLAAGASHTCALLENGTALCWGFNGAGRLGTGDTISSATPRRVVASEAGGDPLGGIADITAGNGHTCALMADATARCWGLNMWGALGNQSTVHSEVPVPPRNPDDPAQPLGDLEQVAAGNHHTCARTAAGSAYCWGWNVAGQVGNGTTIVVNTLPRTVVDPDDPTGPMGGVAHISAGNIHSCAITDGGLTYCWGQNTFGQLGNGLGPENFPVATVVVDPTDGESPLVGLETVVAGGLHACAVTAGGTGYCWGLNESGQLGDGGFDDSAVPVRIADPDDPSSALAALGEVTPRQFQTCAARLDGTAYCWGNNDSGQLGDGSTDSRPLPGPVRPSAT
jgi:alpha-tubulin suppressor-like RCC1 family protein